MNYLPGGRAGAAQPAGRQRRHGRRAMGSGGTAVSDTGGSDTGPGGGGKMSKKICMLIFFAIFAARKKRCGEI